MKKKTYAVCPNCKLEKKYGRTSWKSQTKTCTECSAPMILAINYWYKKEYLNVGLLKLPEDKKIHGIRRPEYETAQYR